MTVQKHVRFDDGVVRLVDDWRKQQDKIPSFNQAVNVLVQAGSDAFQNEKYAQRIRRGEITQTAFGDIDNLTNKFTADEEAKTE